MSAQLFVAATPIGHLDDISYRAIQVLKSVSHILCQKIHKLQHNYLNTLIFKHLLLLAMSIMKATRLIS